MERCTKYGLSIPLKTLEELRENKKKTGVPICQQLVRAYEQVKKGDEDDKK